MLLFISLTFISLLALYTRTPAPVSAQANDTLNFQARLLTDSGSIVPDGTYNVEFKLYDQESAGTALWTETREFNTDAADLHVEVKSGYLSVYLGDKTNFPTSIDWNNQHWLTMNIGGTTTTPSWDGEMTPRLRLTSVPFAFAAESAQTATSLEDVQGTNTGTLQFDTLTTNQTITLPDATGTVALLQRAQTFTELQTFSAAGTGLQVTNDADIGANLTSNTLAVGSSNQFVISSAGTITAATGITSSGSITFSGLDCTVFGNDGKLTTTAAGVLQCADDIGGSGSGGVTTLNSLDGALTIQGTTNQVTVTDNTTDTITISLPQDINTTSNVTFNNIAADGTLSVASTSTFNNTLTVTAGGLNITG
ncbi:MAG: hypothetical protein LC687_02630, partial [Actinobacteria bacterium]|nr:hypothetical protein [Actinomycetota bacterium]MCA1806748.1 hypothetical protein [Actinomycetota bacterium]